MCAVFHHSDRADLVVLVLCSVSEYHLIVQVLVQYLIPLTHLTLWLPHWHYGWHTQQLSSLGCSICMYLEASEYIQWNIFFLHT